MFKPKDILFSEDVEAKFLAGAEKVYNAVTTTMGAGGNLVCFDSHDRLYPTATKDGVSVASQIVLDDPFENLSAQLMIEGARKQVHKSGDGTTLTILLAYEIYKNGVEALKDGGNRTLFKQEMDNAKEFIISEIKKRSIKADANLIRDIATISTNGSDELAYLISTAIKKVGKYGIIKSGKSYTSKHELDHSNGYSIKRGIKFPEFMTKVDICDYQEPNIVVTDQPIMWSTDLLALGEMVQKEPTVIFCPECREEALGAIRQANTKQGAHIVVIEPESIGASQKFELADIACITGATFIEREGGINFKDLKKAHLGKADSVYSVYSKQTTVIKRKSKGGNYNERLEALKKMLGDDNEVLKERAKVSMAKLSSGVATIKVFADTETEQKEIIDRVDDAILACKSAQEMGIVNGGGVELFNIAKLKEGFALPLGQIQVFQAIRQPMLKICSNADFKIGAVNVNGYSLDKLSTTNESMIKLGIVDPAKVLITALEHAISVAGTMLKTTCAMADKV